MDTYTFSQAMAIAGISPGNLGNWRKRYPELLESDYFTPPEKGKRSAGLDFGGVMFLVIVGRLFKLGFTVVEAAEAAWLFTDVGEKPTRLLKARRAPGELTDEPSRTLIILKRTKSGEAKSQLIHTRPETTVTEVTMFEDIAVIIDVTALAAMVRQELDRWERFPKLMKQKAALQEIEQQIAREKDGKGVCDE